MQPLQNSGGYTRRQALKDHMQAENDNDQAVDNLKLVVDSLQKDESLKDATDSFIDLLDAFGNNSTDETRSAYRQIDHRVKMGEDRNVSTDNYVKLMRAENQDSDASGNFAAVDRAVDKDRGRTESTDGFNSILRKLSNNSTEETRTAFGRVVDSLRKEESLTEAVGVFNDLVDGENDTDHALQNYVIVDKSLAPEESRPDAADSFSSILRTFGQNNTDDAQGAYRDVNGFVGQVGERGELTESFVQNAKVVLNNDGSAGEARESFTTVAGSLRDNEELDGALETFQSIVRNENDPGQAIDGYRMIDSSLTQDEVRRDATNDYNSLLKAVGQNATDDAQASYRKLDGRVQGGESRHNATQNFLEGLRLENSFEDAMSNFDVVSGAVDRGWSRDESTHQFHRMLKTFGNNDTSDATSHFNMVLHSLREKEQLGEAVSLHGQIFRAENDSDQVASGYRLVDSVVSEEVTREAATEYYVSLLKEYGSNNTSGAQQAFRETAEIILG